MLIESFNDFLALAGSNIIVTGLVVWLGRIWSERIARNEKAEIDERLKRIEQEYNKINTKDEQYHSISKNQYELYFKERCEKYKELSKLTSAFYKLYVPINTEEDHTNYSFYLKFQEIHEMILENEFFLTTELCKLNHDWVNNNDKEFKNTINNISKDISKLNSNLTVEQRNHQCILIRSKYYGELFLATKENIETINNQIEKDIQDIKEFIVI